MTCRHGFHPGRCLAPACENAPALGAAPRPGLRRGVREVTAARREVREVSDAAVREAVAEHGVVAAARVLDLTVDAVRAALKRIGGL